MFALFLPGAEEAGVFVQVFRASLKQIGLIKSFFPLSFILLLLLLIQVFPRAQSMLVVFVHFCREIIVEACCIETDPVTVNWSPGLMQLPLPDKILWPSWKYILKMYSYQFEGSNCKIPFLNFKINFEAWFLVTASRLSWITNLAGGCVPETS